MIEHVPDINAAGYFGYTALHCALIRGAASTSSEAIDALVEAGASIEARAIYDETPLHIAAGECLPAAVTSLLRHGADVNARGDVGDTPLHCAVAGSETIHEAAEVVDLLLRSGADVDAQDEDGETPLHNVARKAGLQGVAELVDLLLRSGADETITNDDGNTPMYVVGAEVEEGNRFAEDVIRVEELLLDAPFDKAWRRRGYLALCRAHPDRLQIGQESTSQHSDMVRRACDQTKRAKAGASGCKEPVGGSLATDRTGDGWVGVVEKVLGLQEEGIFRMIVGYL